MLLMKSRRARLLALALTTLAWACASAPSRDAVLSRVQSGLDAAEKVFVARDGDMQMAIVAAASSREDGQAKLAEHRKKRDKIAAAFVFAYGAVAAASVDLTASSLEQAARAAAAAVRALGDLSP
jgi:hypothetical protein